ncbi:Ser-Thr-rich GPI-anchored membrane family protein [Dapis sp. BLCC M126]|uniref:Ser-Thr-rich GPI-anchored membrane family protein n=1 Tax=Dapis sp. BLCC M126 TaxID=3400189 RepID=UPI003CFB2DA7
MENIFGDQSNILEQQFTNPMLAGIDRANVSNEWRSLSAIKSSVESLGLEVQQLNTSKVFELTEPKLLLASNSPPGEEDPIIGKENEAVAEKNDSLTNPTNAETRIQARTRSSSSVEKVNITSPTSSTSLEPGQRYTIRWTDNFRDNVKLELYKGSSWEQTISNSTSSDGSYSWTVPTSLSSGSDYRIRIRNVNNGRLSDFSSNFTIEPEDFITVTAPNGGNTLEPGKSYTITWNDNIDENVNIKLLLLPADTVSISRNITSSTSSDGSYTWTVPENVVGIADGNSEYKIQITSVSDNSVSDLSNSSFTIEPDEQVNITSPTSRTNLEPGDRYTIRWNDNFSDNVRLDLYKGSSLQQTISRSTRSDGSHSWTVPTSLSSGSNYRIRIRNVNDSSVSDFSSNFTIEPDEQVNITSPTSSTSLEPGQRYTIRWNDNFRDDVRLDLYKGSSLQQTISRSTRSDGSYSWTVPTSLSSGSNYRIRIRNVNDSSVSDFSSNFTIEPDEQVNITSPTSRTNLEPGDRYTIRWNDNFSDNVRLDLYKGSSLQQTISRSTRSDGSHSWTVPTSLSSGSDYRIRIRNVNDSSVSDFSSNFTIEPDEQVNITSPTSRTNLEPGDRYTIRWTDNFSDNVRLDLYKGNSFQQTISRSTRSDGSHPWTVPTSLSSGSNYRIRIRNVNDSSVSDFSSNFTIEPDEQVNITSPTSSTSLEPGQRYTIRWNDNFRDDVRLDLYKGSSLQQTISRSTRSDGSYSWTVPTSLSSGSNYRIRIRNVNDSSVSDFSSNFTIEPDEQVNITSPTSRTNLEPGDRYTIRWNDNFSDNVRLDLYKGSSLQQTISRSTRSDGSHSWTVPTSLSSGSDYRIRIRNVNDSSVSDFSSNFTIAAVTPPPEEENSLGTARNIGTISGSRSFRDSVSRSDTNDFYRFNVSQSGIFTADLTGLSGDADVRLIKDRNNNGRIDRGEVEAWQWERGSGSESIRKFVTRGTYFLQVNSYRNQSTNYNLTTNFSAASRDNHQFSIEIDVDGSVSLTSQMRNAVEEAASFWENVISHSSLNLNHRLTIDVEGKDLGGRDGGGIALAEAGPRNRTTDANGNWKPMSGIARININPEALEQLSDIDYFKGVMIHEFGHVLGLGRAGWGRNNLTSGASYKANTDAGWAYGELLGTFRQTAIPLTTGEGEGSDGAHWKEEVFGDEIMTHEADDDYPLSQMTIASLRDMGWNVNYGAAEEYSLP